MAGKLNLAATGIQDQWLTGEPKFSYFLMNYKRHTKFSIEAIETPFNGDPDFDASFECNIPRNKGDLIRSMMLKLLSTTQVIQHTRLDLLQDHSMVTHPMIYHLLTVSVLITIIRGTQVWIHQHITCINYG